MISFTISLLLLIPSSPEEEWQKLAGQAMLLTKAGQHQEAKEKLDKAVQLAPDRVELYSLRGAVHFRLAMIKESLADFERQIKLKPATGPAHWQRGLTLYYADLFKEGVAQFTTSDKEEPEDVENAVWHLLCNARVKGLDAARKELLKVEKDSRIPMMEVYKLFAGKSTVENVLAVAEKGKTNEVTLNNQRFYAHLYCGLFEEMVGHNAQSLQFINKAIKDYPIDHYMMDVARVHVKLRTKP